MKQAQDFQKKMAEIQERMKTRIVEASSGGGAVSVKFTGKGEIIDVKISEELIKSGDKGMLEELMIAAVNEGLKKSHKILEDEMSRITGGLNIPGLLP